MKFARTVILQKYCIHIIFIKTQHTNRRRFVTKRYSVVNTRNFLSSAFYRYSVDHCSSPTKQAGGHTDYLLYISTIKKLLFKTYNGYGKDLKEFICHRNR